MKKAKKAKSIKKHTNDQKITPMGDRVFVKVAKEIEKTTSAGIIIPESAGDKKSVRGKVVAVGDGRITDEGKRVPMHVKVGDTILFSDYAGEHINIEGEDYYVVGESSILAIIK